MTAIHISLAVVSDIDQLCELLDSLFTQEVEFSVDHVAQRRGLEMIISNPAVGHILVARQDHKIIAMVSILYSISTALGARVGIIEDMVVSPIARASGIGSKLLRYTLDFAKDNGCERLTLLTDHDNSDGQRFYKHHGFIPSSMIPMRILL